MLIDETATLYTGTRRTGPGDFSAREQRKMLRRGLRGVMAQAMVVSGAYCEARTTRLVQR